MRAIKSLSDVQIVLKQLLDWQNAKDTKDWDMHGLHIVNLGNGVNPGDAVNLGQIPNLVIPTKPPATQYYSIPFSSSGIINTGDLMAPFIVGRGREGVPNAVLLSCTSAPTQSDLTMNMQIINPNSLTPLDLLYKDIDLPIGSTGVVSSSQFINPLPNIGYETKIIPTITNGGGAGYVSIVLVVQRIGVQ